MIEKMMKGKRGIMRSRRAIQELGERWVKAGCPHHYVEVYEKGKGVRRVLSTKDRRQALEDKRFPERARIRKAEGELKLKRRRLAQK